MQKARITINREFKKGFVDDRIYGSFVEHMGRVVYSGIYEPDQPLDSVKMFWRRYEMPA